MDLRNALTTFRTHRSGTRSQFQKQCLGLDPYCIYAKAGVAQAVNDRFGGFRRTGSNRHGGMSPLVVCSKNSTLTDVHAAVLLSVVV